MAREHAILMLNFEVFEIMGAMSCRTCFKNCPVPMEILETSRSLPSLPGVGSIHAAMHIVSWLDLSLLFEVIERGHADLVSALHTGRLVPCQTCFIHVTRSIISLDCERYARCPLTSAYPLPKQRLEYNMRTGFSLPGPLDA